ncbi:unnamed protein product [Effrenium voratum]|uniref:Uncharacterized protein n=1 Tax=Effrenium voratum TaxID=2562239 RepID=A0AA36HLS0_9DINO|nr:unnamed protein product [Effrenium voratum]
MKRQEHVVPSHAAGMDTKRTLEMRRGLNTQGMVANDSYQTRRTLAAHSLLGTRDQTLLIGAERSRQLRELQVVDPAHFPSYMQRSLSESTLQRWQEGPPKTTTLSPPEVIATQDIRLRAALAPAGTVSETWSQDKICNWSAVKYNLLAEQATPIRSWDKTGFMALGHRDPSAPGVWLPKPRA